MRRHGAAGAGIFVTTANLITIGRLVLVPLITWLIVAPQPLAAFLVFVLAAVSDGIDGFIARQFNQRSDLGAYLDPLADKALLVSIYVALTTLNEIPVWLTILVVSRDVLIIGGVVLAWMLAAPMPMRPSVVSKVNTLAQITLAAVALADLAFSANLATLRIGLHYLVALFTIASAGLYMADWIRHMNAASSAVGDKG
jgi:cardiolipin synthase